MNRFLLLTVIFMSHISYAAPITNPGAISPLRRSMFAIESIMQGSSASDSDLESRIPALQSELSKTNQFLLGLGTTNILDGRALNEDLHRDIRDYVLTVSKLIIFSKNDRVWRAFHTPLANWIMQLTDLSYPEVDALKVLSLNETKLESEFRRTMSSLVLAYPRAMPQGDRIGHFTRNCDESLEPWRLDSPTPTRPYFRVKLPEDGE